MGLDMMFRTCTVQARNFCAGERVRVICGVCSALAPASPVASLSAAAWRWAPSVTSESRAPNRAGQPRLREREGYDREVPGQPRPAGELRRACRAVTWPLQSRAGSAVKRCLLRRWKENLSGCDAESRSDESHTSDRRARCCSPSQLRSSRIRRSLTGNPAATRATAATSGALANSKDDCGRAALARCGLRVTLTSPCHFPASSRTDVDRARTGDLPFVFDAGFGFERRDPEPLCIRTVPHASAPAHAPSCHSHSPPGPVTRPTLQIHRVYDGRAHVLRLS